MSCPIHSVTHFGVTHYATHPSLNTNTNCTCDVPPAARRAASSALPDPRLRAIANPLECTSEIGWGRIMSSTSSHTPQRNHRLEALIAALNAVNAPPPHRLILLGAAEGQEHPKRKAMEHPAAENGATPRKRAKLKAKPTSCVVKCVGEDIAVNQKHSRTGVRQSSCDCGKSTSFLPGIGLQMKFYNPDKPRGQQRMRNMVAMMMFNVVDRKKYVICSECPAIAKEAMEFYLANKSDLGVDKAIKLLKEQSFVIDAKAKAAARRIARKIALKTTMGRDQ